jgi:hypothetical protein
MIKLYIINPNGTIDATQFITDYTWSGDYQQCSRTLSFGILSSPTDQNIQTIICDLGNVVMFILDDVLLFQGYIVNRQKSTDSSVINITCYDRGIYLKRNNAVYKFKDATPESITKTICSDFGIASGSIAETGVQISRNFIGVSLYEIIQTAYTIAAETTGEAYQIRFDGTSLCVFKKGITDKTLVITGGSNLLSASTTESIESMVNQIVIYDKNDEPVDKINDENLIKLYGLFQNYLSKKDDEDVTSKAKKILSDNGLEQKITVNCLGNTSNISGNSVIVREPYTGLYGHFYIDNDSHTWRNGQYNNQLTLNFKKLMYEADAGSTPS